jgi:hypothetical protein
MSVLDLASASFLGLVAGAACSFPFMDAWLVRRYDATDLKQSCKCLTFRLKFQLKAMGGHKMLAQTGTDAQMVYSL